MSLSLAMSLIFFGFALFGILALTLQYGVVRSWVRKAPRKPLRTPGISILKPLCGVDDDLAGNLEHFARLEYPNYELVLGVKTAQDPAYRVAQDVVRRFPKHVRLVLQRGEPGLNPKVNQLITLSAAARHDILVVSDSNTRVPAGYLDELAGCFEDPEVACASNPIVGVGEQRAGSAMDAMHLGASIGAGMIAAKVLSNKDLVVGKSMAIRRSALRALGGFEVAKDHLAEDYVIGRKITAELGMKVAICRLPVYNVSQNRSVRDFFARYVRWSIIHRTAIAPTTYIGQALINPVPLAAVGFALAPSRGAAYAFFVTWMWKAMVDLGSTRQLRPDRGFGLWAPMLVLVKDFLLAIAWWNGVFSRTVTWRGTPLRVEHGSRLVLPEGFAEEFQRVPSDAPVPVPAPAWSQEHHRDRSVA